DALIRGDEARERVQQRGLTATGAAADDDVQPGLDGGFHEHRHLGGERLVVQQVLQLERVGAEAANAHGRAVERQRLNDGVDTAAVRQAGIDHWRGLVHAPADLRHDPVDNLQQVVVVTKLDVGLLQLAAAFDVNLVRPVDQNIADGRVFEQHLQRAEAERFVEHLVDEAFAFHAVEQRVFRVAQPLYHQPDLTPQRVAGQVA